MSYPTAWSSDWPLDAGVYAGEYDVAIQPWFACRERAWATGDPFFPAVSRPWANVTTTAAVDNGDGTSTFTISGGTFCTDGTAPDPWSTPCDDTPNASAPLTWRASADHLDPMQCASGNVASWTTNTITLNVRLADSATAGYVTAVSDFVGRKLFIYAAGNLWWNERWPEIPNVAAVSTGTIASATTTQITLTDRWYDAGSLVGKELMCRDTTGKLLRLAITANTLDKTTGTLKSLISYGGTTNAPAGAFAIIAAGGRFLPGQPSPQIFAYYMGLTQSLYSHYPTDDSVQLANIPLLFETVADAADPDACDPPGNVAVYDADAFTSIENVCGPSSQQLNPNVTKTYRWLQAWLEAREELFEPPGVPKGESVANAFNTFKAATWYATWGAPNATVTTGTVSGDGITLGSAVDFNAGFPQDVVWATLDSGGAEVHAGPGTLTSSTTLTGSFVSPDDEGVSILISPGWKRFFERQIGRLHDVRYFQPDEDPDALTPGTLIVPPREPVSGETAGPGKWITREASDHYTVVNQFGTRGDSTADVDEFADGHLARLVGDSYTDPTTNYAPSLGVMPPIVPYVDRSYVGPRSYTNQGRLDAARFGTATGGSTTQLVDTSKNWWTCDFWGNPAGDGVQLTISGSDSISGTTVSLSSQSGSAFFAQTPPRFTEQCIEGQSTDDHGNTIWIPRFITAQSGTALTLSESMPSCTGWRIREPDGLLNTWKGLPVTLTPIDAHGNEVGPDVSGTVQGNTDTVLFIAAIDNPVAAGWRYGILTPRFSDVYKRVSGVWVKPTGMDAVRRGITTPGKFPDDASSIQPDIVLRYGRLLHGDSPVEMMNQVYAGINVLLKTPLGCGWTAKGEQNVYAAGSGAEGATGVDQDSWPLSYFKGLVESAWGSNTAIANAVASPGAASTSSADQVPQGSSSYSWSYSANADGSAIPHSLAAYSAGATANYAYLESSAPATFGGLTYSANGWAIAGLDAGDDPLPTCPEVHTQFAAGSSGFTRDTWKDVGGMTADGMGNLISGQVGSASEPPWASFGVQEQFQIATDGGGDPILDGSGCLTYTTTATAYSAQGTGEFYVIGQAVVVTWHFGFVAP